MTDRDYAELAQQSVGIRGLSIDSHDPMNPMQRSKYGEDSQYGVVGGGEYGDVVPMRDFVREKEES